MLHGACVGGICAPPVRCLAPGQACTASVDCCVGLFCVIPPGARQNGACPPVVWTGGSCTYGGECCSGDWTR